MEDLAVLLHLKEPTVSHHLAKLQALQLVTLTSEVLAKWRSEPSGLN